MFLIRYSKKWRLLEVLMDFYGVFSRTKPVQLWSKTEDILDNRFISTDQGLVFLRHEGVPWNGGLLTKDGVSLAWVGEVRRIAGRRPSGSGEVGKRLLQLWKKYGDAFLAREVIGPIAVVLVDSHQGRVLVFRDKAGLLPISFAAIGDSKEKEYVFSSDLEWVLSIARGHGGVQVSKKRLLEFMTADWGKGRADFLSPLKRLRPREVWELNADDGAEIRQYWRPEKSNQPSSEVLSDLKKSLYEVLGDIGANNRPVLQMSGGLDSNAIAAVWSEIAPSRRRPFPAASMVAPDFPVFDESETLDLVESIHPVELERLDISNEWPLKNFSNYNSRVAPGPHYYPGDGRRLYFQRWLSSTFNSETALTGMCAERFLRDGEEWFVNWSRYGSSKNLWQRISWEVKNSGLRGVFREFIRGALRRVNVLNNARNFRNSLTEHSPDQANPWKEPRVWVRDKQFNDNEIGVAASSKKRAQLDSWSWEVFVRGIDRVSRQTGVRQLFPFADERVIELGISLFPQTGGRRWPLRACLDGILDNSLRLRRNSSLFDPFFELGLGRHEYRTVRHLFDEPILSKMSLIDSEEFLHAHRAYSKAAFDGTSRCLGSFRLWATIAAELWLRKLEVAHAQ